jgi:hypothetical protein
MLVCSIELSKNPWRQNESLMGATKYTAAQATGNPALYQSILRPLKLRYETVAQTVALSFVGK